MLLPVVTLDSKGSSIRLTSKEETLIHEALTEYKNELENGEDENESPLSQKLHLRWLMSTHQKTLPELANLTDLTEDGRNCVLSLSSQSLFTDKALVSAAHAVYAKGCDVIKESAPYWLTRIYQHST